MARAKHPHRPYDELMVFVIPAHPDQEMELAVVPNSREALSRRLSASGVYTLTEDLGLPALPCGCPLLLVANDQNLANRNNLQFNARASLFLSENDALFGDVMVLGQGLIEYGEGRIDVGLLSLTPEFHDWRGPGYPVPVPNLPWIG